MAGTEEYIKNYGDVSFTEMPFCDADNIALCEMFYMPLEKVVSADFDDEPKCFGEVANDMFNYMGCKHKPLGIMITKTPSMKMMEMSRYRRFSEMQVVACQEVFCPDPAVQFAAATFLLPNNTFVVAFRGTDDTIAGWKEDFDLYLKKGIPSHSLAVDYLEKAAKKFSGNIIVCGHSKGGNVALYAALNCSKETRDRIDILYNNDGPGFADYGFLATPAYRELLPRYRHFVPSSSMIGMLLAHDEDYTVVKSSKHIGALQHDLATWQVEGSGPEIKDELTMQGKIMDLGLMEIIFHVTDEQSETIDNVINKLIKATGEISLTGFVKNIIPAVDNAAKVWKDIDEDTKDVFKSAFSGVAKKFVEAAKTVKEEAAPAVAQRIDIVAERILANA